MLSEAGEEAEHQKRAHPRGAGTEQGTWGTLYQNVLLNGHWMRPSLGLSEGKGCWWPRLNWLGKALWELAAMPTPTRSLPGRSQTPGCVARTNEVSLRQSTLRSRTRRGGLISRTRRGYLYPGIFYHPS